MLLECVQSALAQTYREIEILVSDDSPNDETEQILEKSGALSDGRVRYIRNPKSLGEVDNINQLFDMARGDRVLLIHDDDWIFPNAVEDLDAPWRLEEGLDVSYGLQKYADENGKVYDETSEMMNKGYFRSEEYFGLQKEVRFSAMMGQLPNNGTLIRTALARKVGNRQKGVCDYDFGLRLALESEKWFLIDKYVSAVRASAESGLRTKNRKIYHNPCDITWNLVENYDLPPHLEKWRQRRLRELAMGTVAKWLYDGKRRQAAKVIFSDKYALFSKFSKKKLLFAALLFFPHAVQRYVIADFMRFR